MRSHAGVRPVVSRSEMQARLDQMMAEIRRMTRDADSVQKKMLNATATVQSDDGLITVTVGPRGQLIDLQIDPRIYRRPDAGLLAHTILETTRRAVEQVSEEVNNVYSQFLPDGFAPDKLTSGLGLPKDFLRQADADVIKSREAQDD